MVGLFCMNEEKIINAVLDLSDQIKAMQEEIFTKKEGREVMDVLGHHTTIMKNIEEDHIFSIEWIKRLQERVDQQDKEIHRIKAQLKLA